MFNFLFAENSGSIEMSKDIVPQSVGVFLINLDRATERLATIKSLVDRLNFTQYRVSAVDGKLLSEGEVQRICDYNRFKKLFNILPERGTIGCSLSHEKVWREFLKSDHEFALILEDDVQFDPQELETCVNKAVEKKDFWDIVSFEMNHYGMPKNVTDLFDDKCLAVYLTAVKHSGCYLINRNTVIKLLNKFYPIIMPIDHYFTASWEFDIRFMGVEPRIVHQRGFESQIKVGESKKINDFGLKLKRAKLNIKIGIVNFLYNLYVLCKSRRLD